MKPSYLYCVICFWISAVPASAQLSLQPFVPSALKVTDIAHCGDQRLFITEQAGRILVSDLEGNVQALPFLDITDRVTPAGGEQGLLGLAFSPQYRTDRRFYVNYINNSGNTVVARFLTEAQDANRADSSSEEILFTVQQPYSNHNGGAMHFGPDGYLYISLGDGGAGGDPGNRAQDLTTRLGKLLRIDVRVPVGYAIPSDNPFLHVTGADSAIWNLGLRNAWRFSFDRITGDKWIADVGQNLWEEINFQAAGSPGGENYGWRCYEGDSVYNPLNCLPASNYVFPVHTYPHSQGCSVTGGYVYRGARYNSWFGKYFFVDYCSGKIQSLAPSDTGGYIHELYGSFGNVSYTTFGEDVYGELYIGKGSSGVYKLADSSCTPVAFISFADTIYHPAGFRLLTTPYHPGFYYRWFYNGTVIPGADNYVLTAKLSGNYRVVVISPDSCINSSKEITLFLATENVFDLYPNPARDEVSLIWSDHLPGTRKIEVIDAAGRLRISRTVQGNQPGYLLDTSSLARGVYIVRIEHQGNFYSEKLVKY